MAESIALKGLPREEKRALLLTQSIETMAQYGYNNTTLDLIAEKVGVSKGTLCYYFNNKETLLLEAFQFAGTSIIAEFKEIVAQFDAPADKVRAGLRMLWQTFRDNPNVIRVYYDFYAQGLFSSQFGAVLADLNSKFRTIFYDLLALSNESSAIEEKPERILTKAAMLACVTDGILKQILVDPEYFKEYDMDAGMDYLIDKICERVEL